METRRAAGDAVHRKKPTKVEQRSLEIYTIFNNSHLDLRLPMLLILWFLYLVNAGALRSFVHRTGRSFKRSPWRRYFLVLTSPAAAYPDGHSESVHNEDEEIGHLKGKVESSAEFIVIQLFYNVDNFLRWLRKIRAWCGVTFPLNSRTHALILR